MASTGPTGLLHSCLVLMYPCLIISHGSILQISYVARSPDTYTHYAEQDGVHAMFTGEISEWPGIDMMSEQHDGECCGP